MSVAFSGDPARPAAAPSRPATALGDAVEPPLRLVGAPAPDVRPDVLDLVADPTGDDPDGLEALPPAAREDAELVARCRDGDAEAYAALFRRWYPRCRTAATRVLGSAGTAGDAEDMAQEALVVAWTRLDQLRDSASFGPWVCRIARNLALDHVKRRRPALSPLDTLAEEHRALVVEGADPQQVVAGRERDRLVRVAARSLRGRDEEVFERVVDDGMSPAQVAEALGVSDNHAYQILFRLRGRMQAGMRAALVWRQGRPRCPELAELVGGEGEAFTPETATTVARHLRRCATCAEEADVHAAPAQLLSGFGAALVARMPHWLLRARADEAVLGVQGADVTARVVAGLGVATTLTAGVLAVTGIPESATPEHRPVPPAARAAVGGAPASTSRPQGRDDDGRRTSSVVVVAGYPCTAGTTSRAAGADEVVEAAGRRPARGHGAGETHGSKTKATAKGRRGRSEDDRTTAKARRGTHLRAKGQDCSRSATATYVGRAAGNTTAAEVSASTSASVTSGSPSTSKRAPGGHGAHGRTTTSGSPPGQGHAKKGSPPRHGDATTTPPPKAGKGSKVAPRARTAVPGGRGDGTSLGSPAPESSWPTDRAS